MGPEPDVAARAAGSSPVSKIDRRKLELRTGEIRGGESRRSDTQRSLKTDSAVSTCARPSEVDIRTGIAKAICETAGFGCQVSGFGKSLKRFL